MLTVDLNVLVIPLERRVWRLFAGESYAFLPAFEQQHVVFLEFPGLPLPHRPLTDQTPRLRERVHAALEVREWLRRGSDAGAKPSSSLDDYADRRWTKRRVAYTAALVDLFGEAAKGDLVLVPDKLSTRRVHIG